MMVSDEEEGRAMSEDDTRPGAAVGTAIRGRRQDDMDRCVALLADVYAADGYPARWPADPHTWLAPEDLLGAWVAEDADGLAGHVVLWPANGDSAAPVWSAASDLPADRLAAVSRLFVAPRARGRGLGARLLAAAHAEANARRLHAALTVVDHDRGALALYERAGWRRVASIPASWALANGEHPLLHYYLAPG